MPRESRSGQQAKLDRLVLEARRAREEREKSYRDQALRLLPWICARCAREFDRTRLRELTVHHKDHNHDHNPSDGSNWELLCIYCHENQHARELDSAGRSDAPTQGPGATHRPFAGLEALLKQKK